jgi:hypothetical protein
VDIEIDMHVEEHCVKKAEIRVMAQQAGNTKSS